MLRLIIPAAGLTLFLQGGASVDAQLGTGATGTDGAELLAFVSQRAQDSPKASCRELSDRATCSDVEEPQAKALGVLICSCSGDSKADRVSAADEFSRKNLLYRLTVQSSTNAWTIFTREVKLLPVLEHARESILKRLPRTRFVLSSADRGSPNRILVRRRDGKIPSATDVAKLKAEFGVAVEVEAISLIQKGKGIQR